MHQSPLVADRRTFIASSATALAATGWVRHAIAQEPATVTADKFIAGKDARLIVHNAKIGELETPLALLREHRITPADILFVRNNQVTEGGLSLAPADADDWPIEFGGLIAKASSIEASELKKLPQREVEMVLQCSGNGRSSFAKAAPVSGSPWTGGAMGNVVFGGVMLADVLKHAGVKIDPQAKFLTAEGRDESPKPDVEDFEHSIPLALALSRSLLVFTLNGKPLPKVHGGPVRLATPGLYGTMNVKWLSKLRFEVGESTTHHHVDRYRTPLVPIEPGEAWKSTLENSEANWNMKIKSTIFSPLATDEVRAGRVEVTGVAWNDGQAKIDAVEVSTDGGNTWRRAALSRPASPYAWHPWKIAVMLRPGKQTILSRAVDALGRAQPLDGSIAWNPAGYTWNGVDAVEVTVAG
jgi:DMSO/TMAO reductase YedYZ molybdopterin-dependent catalytic subunit